MEFIIFENFAIPLENILCVISKSAIPRPFKAFTDDRKNFTLKLLKNIGAERRGGGARLSATEKALDCYSEKELSDLFQDYLSELFYVSNYYQYNGKSNVKKGNITQDGQIYECMFTIDSDKRLALSLRQVIDREQNIFE